MRAEPHSPHVIINRSSPVPLYHQIASAIETEIRAGNLAPGTRVENEIDMAKRLGVSRPTTRQALQDLVDRGLVVRKRGIGTQVAGESIRRPVELTSLYDDLLASGRTPTTKVIEVNTIPASHAMAEKLGVAEGQDICEIKRIRYADDEPLALMTNYLRSELCPTHEQLMDTGLYESLRERGITVHLARQTIGARLATAEEARSLEEKPRSAVLTMERIALDSENNPIEVGSHIYRGSRYTFETTLSTR